MKKSAVLLFIVFSALTRFSVFAERAPDVRSLDRSTFDYSFSRADRETSGDRWMEEARRGTAISIAAWERTAAALFDDPSEYERARASVKAWSEAELEERFASWLKDRFFGREASRLKALLSAAAAAADKRYLYRTDAAGNVVYDAATGDPLTVRPEAGNDTLAADSAARSGELAAARNAALASFLGGMEARFPELSTYVSEDRRSAFMAGLSASLSAAADRTGRELDALIAQEERLFVARRTADVWSLRKQSESEAAAAIASELARETRAECDAGLKALEARVTAASAGTGDLALAGKEWLEMYRTQFSRGLSAWEKAEERFMVRRMEWEREAAKSFSENRQIWADAFEKLSVEQRAWEAKARTLFISGEETFARASANLERNIADAKAEFERDASLRGQATADRARAWVDTYVACGSVVGASRENAEFWLQKMGWNAETAPAFGTAALDSWLSAKRSWSWRTLKQTYEIAGPIFGFMSVGGEYNNDKRDLVLAKIGKNPEEQAALDAAFREKHALWFELDEAEAGGRSSDWEGLVSRLEAYVRTWNPSYAADRSVFDQAAEVERWAALRTGYLAKASEARDALVANFGVAIGSGAGDLRDVLDPGVSSEDFNLDEYQVELIRAKAVAGYWAKRVSIAEAVSAYASDLSAGRATEAESVQAWNGAKASYEAALAAYENAQDALTGQTGNVNAVRDAVNAAAADLKAAETSLENLNSEYALKMSVLATRSTEFLKEEIAAKYKSLLETSGLLNGDASADLRARYLERSLALGRAQSAATAGDKLKELVTGGGSPSLADLKRAVEAISADTVKQDLPPEISGDVQLLDRAVARARAQAEAALEARLDAIALLAAEDASAWYRERAGGESGADLAAKLGADLEWARRSALRAKVELERGALKAVIDEEAAVSAEAKQLAAFASIDQSAAAAALASLDTLSAKLAAIDPASDSDYRAALETLSASDPLVRTLLRGGTLFALSDGSDAAVLFLSASEFAVERAAARENAFKTISPFSPAVEDEWRRESWTGVKDALVRAGAALPANGLPSVSAIGAALRADGRGFQTAFASLYAEAADAAAGAPGWVKREMETWLSSLTEYAAARLLFDGAAPASEAVVENSLKAETARIDALRAALSLLSSGSPTDARPLCAVLACTAGDIGLFSRAVVEHEVVNRIARSLSDAWGAREGDAAAVRAALSSDAAAAHSYASPALRGLAVDRAVDLVLARRAVDAASDPDTLTGYARTARLSAVFSSFSVAEAAAAAQDAFTAPSRAAFSLRAYVKTAFAADVTATDFIAAAQIWVTAAAAAESEEYAAALQAALDDAYSGGVDFTLSSALSRLDGFFNQLLASVSSYVRSTRSENGGASVVCERALALSLASLSTDASYLSAVLSALTLRTADNAAALLGAVSAADFDLIGDSFLGLGTVPYAPEAAAWYNGLLADRAFASRADGYAGEALSGDSFRWSRSLGLGDADALRLAGVIKLGHSGDDPSTSGSILNRALLYAAADACSGLSTSASNLNARILLSRAYEEAAASEQGASSSGISQWRTYLDPALASGLTPVSAGTPEGGASDTALRAAASWREGNLADAYEKAARSTAAVQAAFSGWESDAVVDTALTDFRTAAREYAADALHAWTETDAPRVASAVADAYSSAYRDIHENEYRAAADQTEIARVGSVLRDVSDYAALEAELALLSTRIRTARADYDQAIAAYSERASAFAAAGSAYDASYSNAKAAFQTLEDARFAYEREDAIRRWASTAYLAAGDSAAGYRGPEAELAYARERRVRADIALRALETLYDAEAETRPYADAAYNAMLDSYRASFERMMLSVKARDALSEARAKEMAKNQKLYEDYVKTAVSGPASFARTIQYSSYTPVSEDRNAAWKDLLTIDAAGSLRLACGGDYTLTKLDAAGAARLKDYFELKTSSGIDTNQSTAFERRVREWTARVDAYGIRGDRFRVWGLARDHLISRILKQNGSYEGLGGSLKYADRTKSFLDGIDVGGFLNFNNFGNRMEDFLIGDACTYNTVIDEDGNETQVLVSVDRLGLDSLRKNAWESLGADERADLEFFLALTLTGVFGDPTVSSALARASELEQYNDVDALVQKRISEESWRKGQWFLNIQGEYDRLVSARNGYLPAYDEVRNAVAANGYSLSNKAATVTSSYAAYTASCRRLRELDGETGGAEVDWLTIENSLRASKKLSRDEIARMSLYYRQYIDDGQTAGKSSIAALSAIASWTRSERDDLKRDIDDKRNNDEQTREAAQTTYRETFNRYVDGRAAQAELTAAASAAYGSAAPAIKTHLIRLEEIDADAAFSYLRTEGAFAAEYGQAVSGFAALIERASSARYAAELAAREAEWDVIRADLAEKLASWRTAANLILERGRSDWKTAKETMNETYNAWLRRFQNEYAQSDAVWSASWLQSMKEKAEWTSRATKAADNAAGAAVLALIGSDAEAAGRAMDGLGSYLIARTDAKEADTVLTAALGMAGIAKMTDAFGAASSSAATAATTVRTGLGGPSFWDSAKLQAAAASFAKKTNEELAARQARVIAAQAREAAQKAVAGLQENLEAANKGVKESMDETFVMEGKWQRAGSNYTKRVLVHSTLFNPEIYENASAEGYIAYVMSPWTLQTDLSDGALSNLDSIGIQALVKKAQKEVEKKSEEAFGTEAENNNKNSRKQLVYFYKTLKRQTGTRKEKRSDNDGYEYEVEVPVYEEYQEIDDTKTKTKTWGAGAFGAHVGFDPTLKENPNIDDGIDKMWQDEGKGEVGRLLRSYIYWSLKENRGLAELNKPAYEKRFWDDRGQWFKAPTIRGTVDIGMQVVTTAAGVIGTPFTGGASLAAAVAVNTALNMADDAVFTMMDIAGGYRGWEEAGLEFGKKALTSAATSAITFGFGGLGSGLQSVAGIDGVIGRTMLSGMQSFTTSTVTSAINAIQWNGSGLTWSSGAFGEGLRGGLIGAATGITSSLTSGVMNLGLEGFTKNVYSNGAALNNFLGGLAGQGVNYALTGDFALNVLNASDLSGGALQGGLLELHLGRNGMGMNIGSGGASANWGTIAKSIAGIEAWGVNARLLSSGQREAYAYASAMRTLYSQGTTERAAFDDILSGRRDIEKNADGDFKAKTVTDQTTGITTMTIGKDAFADGSRFGLNILFAHEAYRNGIDDGEAGQNQETARAVSGHIGAAASLAAIYGDNGISADALKELNAVRTGNLGELAKLMNGYDSGGDYWKLKKDGSLVYDNQKDLYDENGKLLKRADPTKSNSENFAAWLGISVGDAKKMLADAWDGTKYDPNKVVKLSPEQRVLFEKFAGERYFAPPATPVAQPSALEKITTWFAGKIDQAGDWFSKKGTEFSKFFGWNTKTLQQNEAAKTTFEIAGKNGAPIILNKIGTDNPVLAQLVKQTDSAFSDIPEIAEGGCNFRVVQAYCELLAGKALTTDQIRQIWRATAGTNIMDSDGFINSADSLADKTLAVLGRTDFGLTFGTDWRKNGTLIGYRIRMPYGSDSHYALGDTFKKLIYNPGSTYTAANDWRNIYVYPKK